MARFPYRGAVTLALAMAAVVAAVGVPAPAVASEAARDGGQLPGVVQTGLLARPNLSDTDGAGVWVWGRGRRAYYLTEAGTGGPSTGFNSISAVDLDTQEVSTELLTPRGYGNHGRVSARGFRGAVAVDEIGGRLFVAYSTLPPINSMDAMAQGRVCASSDAIGGGCFAGVQAIDARTLQRVGPLMPLRPVSATGAPLAAQLRAMEFSPSRGEGDADKVLVLLAEHVAGEGFQGANNPRVLLGHTPAHVVQFDIASGEQDWAVQIDACRGSRDSRDSGAEDANKLRPHPGAVYRKRSLANPSVVAACHSGSNHAGTLVRIPLDAHGMPASLPVSVKEPGDIAAGDASAQPQTWVVQSPSPLVTVGPDKTWEMIADPASDRMLLKVVDGPIGQMAEVWWVYDATLGQFAGTIGIGAAEYTSSNAVLDTERGRLYVLAAERGVHSGRTLAGGLFMADVRRTPVAQALVFPELTSWALDWQNAPVINLGVIPPVAEGEPAILLAPDRRAIQEAQYRVIEDRVPLKADPADDGFAGRTLDLTEVEGVTSSALDGAARGYAARLLLISGAEAAARVGPADPVGLAYQCNSGAGTGAGLTMPCGNEEAANPRGSATNSGLGKELYLPDGAGLVPGLPEGCVESNPEVILGFVGPDGPNVVDSTGARGGAEAVKVDSSTAADLEAPVSRCSGADWEDLASVPVFGGLALLPNGVATEPQAEVPWTGYAAACVSGEDQDSPRSKEVGDTVTQAFAAQVECEPEESAGFAYVRGNRMGDVNVAEALSSFRIYRDPGRGVVARVESVVRGLEIGATIRIDGVRGVAESWANGRKFDPPPLDDGAVYNPNCDADRTAGTCFRRQLVGVTVPGFSCGPCGDEQRLLAALNRALGSNGKAMLREPDPILARGADNGFQAAITKRAEERFSDLVMNNDLLQTVLPTLEIVRYAHANRLPSGGGPRGRQIYQFAGVEVSSSYGISCLLVYDEVANTCGTPAEPPGSIAISLTDADGKALAGGAFEVRRDADADGVAGLKDALLTDGVCVTADDGVGTCSFDSLQPGSYLVSQVAAPPGYGKVAEPFVVELASGEARTVTFQNTSNMSAIEISAADEAGKPLGGAVFAVYPDPDSDGKVAEDADPTATCTTDAAGSCSMRVPVGSYVLVQKVAPGGLEPIEPVAFAFASGGQTATVGVVNYPVDRVPAPDPAPAPMPVYSDPPRPVVIEDAEPYVPDNTAAPATEPVVSLPRAVGGTIVQVIQTPGDALRLLSRDPKQAVAWTASIMMFALAAMSIRRRRHAIALIQG